MSADEDDSVGYCRPPKAQRFGAATAGNKKGRPPGSKNIKTLVHQLAHERRVMQQNGRTVAYTIVELLFMTLQRKAMSGDIRAIKLLDHYRAAFGQTFDETPPAIFILPERDSGDIFERRREADRARLAYEQEKPIIDDRTSRKQGPPKA